MDLPEGVRMLERKAWDQPLVERKYAELLQEATGDRQRQAQLLAVAQRECAWLYALPAAILENVWEPNCLRIFIARRLGAKVCLAHKCRCGQIVVEWRKNGLKCKLGAERFIRHGNQ